MEHLTPQQIEQRIFIIRDHKVMVDRDLAELYQVKTWAINQAVKRNPRRFPSDFVFQLTETERNELITNCDRLSSLKHSSLPPYVFTEQGVSMLSSVLRSERAILVNVQIMRVFARIRELLATNKELFPKLTELEKKYDVQFKVVFDAIRELMDKPADDLPRIKGFRHE